MSHIVTILDGADAALMHELERLRTLVWADTPFTAEVRCGALDEFDECASHFLVRSGDELVGAGRLTIHTNLHSAPDGEAIGPLGALLPPDVAMGPLGVMSRLVVHPGFRQRGIASAIDLHRVQVAHSKGAQGILVGIFKDDPRDHSLKRRGFTQVADYEKIFGATPAAGRLYLWLPEC